MKKKKLETSIFKSFLFYFQAERIRSGASQTLGTEWDLRLRYAAPRTSVAVQTHARKYALEVFGWF